MSKPLAVLELLYDILAIHNPVLKQKIDLACRENAWFTTKHYLEAVQNIRSQLLDPSVIRSFAETYTPVLHPKRVGLVLAGNIPLVGMHDIICVILSGHHLRIKLSDKDSAVYRYLFEEMYRVFPDTKIQYQIVEKLHDFDAVIATGSNNSSRYFEYYFGKYPHIIRKNRSSVAILTGEESDHDIEHLGSDIHTYFGLGCRNVSKIFVPRSYQFEPFLNIQKQFSWVIDHPKYKNNYDFNLSVLIINNQYYMSTGHLLLVEDQKVASRIAMLHYEYYDSLEDLHDQLKEQSDELQCIVTNHSGMELDRLVAFGETQRPGLSDFADGVNTMEFLLKAL